MADRKFIVDVRLEVIGESEADTARAVSEILSAYNWITDNYVRRVKPVPISSDHPTPDDAPHRQG